ncbi:DUF805 domain-containing protein [Paenibacillus luteus]|uniref:DUF805 domain-containing protein n=1 Tax=Paenibacillus luteus TaxID=2545753 RepID=UPI001142A436|nr:DUF805 domain-containing protein [Paenibacillus luteus]
MEWYLKVIKNYVEFSGRARRTEYWMFILFNILASIVLSIIERIIGIEPALSGLYSLFILLPSLAVGVRRLHDTGRSGLWLLLSFIPLIGAIILLVFFCQDSEDNNQYGPNPKVF